MINRKQQALLLARKNITMMMLGQKKRRAERSEDAVVDRGNLRDLQGIDRGMDHRASDTLVISRAAGWGGYANAVSPEHFKGYIVNVNLGDDRPVNALERKLIQRNIR